MDSPSNVHRNPPYNFIFEELQKPKFQVTILQSGPPIPKSFISI